MISPWRRRENSSTCSANRQCRDAHFSLMCEPAQNLDLNSACRANPPSARGKQRIILFPYSNVAMSGDWIHDQSFRFIFQANDRAIDLPSASWQRRKSYQSVAITPDFYYTSEDGYRYFYSDSVPPWESREPKVFWRGSTSGPREVDCNSIVELPRYKLCAESLKLGDIADIAFFDVVHTQPPSDQPILRQRLHDSGFLRDWVDMRHYAKFKMIVQIDGNANSWGLIKKLRLGSCLLIVDSDWRMFHSDLIQPWVHYVPIRADLSDFVEKAHWCLQHDNEARQIAAEGRAWALARDYDAELSGCANSIRDLFGRRPA